jgi:ribosome-associated protein
MNDSDGLELAIHLARLAHADHCGDVTVMDLRDICGFANFFVICSGTSERQMRAVAEHLCEHGRRVNDPVYAVTGLEAATWVLLDFIDVVVHVFTPEHRQYYDLELRWGDAPRIQWEN